MSNKQPISTFLGIAAGLALALAIPANAVTVIDFDSLSDGDVGALPKHHVA